MDKLEQRLNQLKNSYEEIQTTSNPDKIIEKIRKSEQKRKKVWIAQLPYVASFIGVLIIGSLLALQLLSSQKFSLGESNEKPEDSPSTVDEKVTEEQIKEKHQMLVSYYEELFSTSSEYPVVEIKSLEALPYIQETRKFIEEVGSPKYKVYKNKKDLEQSFEEYMAFVRDRFEMPKTDLEQLKKSKKEDLSSEVMDLMRKQEDLKQYYQNQLNSYATSGAILKISQDFVIQRESLLSVDGIENEEIREFAQNLKDNGFTLMDLEGGHEVEIDFQGLYETFGGKLNEAVIEFINIKQNRIITDGHLQGNWNTVAQRIALLETIRSNYEGSSEIMIEKEVNQYLYLYFNGFEGSQAFLRDGTLDPTLQESYEEFLEKENPDTDAYKRIDAYYNALKKGNFHKSAQPENEKQKH